MSENKVLDKLSRDHRIPIYELVAANEREMTLESDSSSLEEALDEYRESHRQSIGWYMALKAIIKFGSKN